MKQGAELVRREPLGYLARPVASNATRYRVEFERQGGSLVHRQMIAWVPEGSSVLELGCASGYIGRFLIEHKRCRVTGVEIDPSAAAEARDNGLTVLEGSLEDADFRASLSDRYDVVMAGDVIEHLREPAPVLDHLKKWLLPTGKVILSVPNIACWVMRKQLFFGGDFEYQETGILDRTHLRFFTWDTLHALLAEQGWQVSDRYVGVWDVPFGTGLMLSFPRSVHREVSKLGGLPPPGRALYRALHACSAGLMGAGEKLAGSIFLRWPNLCARQIVLLLTPPGGAE